MISLNGKVALITGASRGIGAAAAIRFAEAGAHVVVNYVSSELEASRVVQRARSEGVRAISVQADVSEFEQVRYLCDRTLEEFGSIDVLVANAGIWQPAPIDEMSEQQWRQTIEINLSGTYGCCHFAAIAMKRQRSGSIITVSSTAGQRGEAGYSHYAASKGGMISLTKSLASELGPFGIRVNSVAPGWVDTEMSANTLRVPCERDKIEAAMPIGRVATADDIAGPILFLASDLARHITGEILNVNGGSVLCG
jgi:3-oxoacyl-[acyl-carrier protein] reductase